MKTTLVFIYLLSFGIDCIAQTLEQNFRNPPVSARPKALWPWVNGNTNLSQVTYELEEAKRKGMGGFDIWDIGASVDPNTVAEPKRISPNFPMRGVNPSRKLRCWMQD